MLPACARSPVPWHRRGHARNLLADLGPLDVRLVWARGGVGADRLAWHPVSDRAIATFAALDSLRKCAVGPAFARAVTDNERLAALTAAQSAPSVAGAVAARFGDPDSWLALGPAEATRRFRANRALSPADPAGSGVPKTRDGLPVQWRNCCGRHRPPG